MSEMTITLPNGVKVSGNPADVRTTVLAMGEDADIANFYHSSSKGWLYIPHMNLKHLFNATLKEYRGWLDSVQAQIASPGTKAEIVAKGPFAEGSTAPKTLKKLMAAFVARSASGDDWRD